MKRLFPAVFSVDWMNRSSVFCVSVPDYPQIMLFTSNIPFLEDVTELRITIYRETSRVHTVSYCRVDVQKTHDTPEICEGI